MRATQFVVLVLVLGFILVNVGGWWLDHTLSGHRTLLELQSGNGWLIDSLLLLERLIWCLGKSVIVASTCFWCCVARCIYILTLRVGSNCGMRLHILSWLVHGHSSFTLRSLFTIGYGLCAMDTTPSCWVFGIILVVVAISIAIRHLIACYRRLFLCGFTLWQASRGWLIGSCFRSMRLCQTLAIILPLVQDFDRL